MDNKIEFLKKLKALAERGVGGEKDVAQNKLNELTQKYGVSLESLDDNDKGCPHTLLYQVGHERMVIQLIVSVLGPTEMWGSKRSDLEIIYNSTKLQSIEIESLYSIYSIAFNDAITIMLEAFVSKHKLYEKGVAAIEPTEEEISRHRRVGVMSGLLDDVETRKQLNS